MALSIAAEETAERIDPRLLADTGEVFASGFFEVPDAPPVARMARAVRRHLERLPPPPWEGQPLYPAGAYAVWGRDTAVYFSYFHSMGYNRAVLQALRSEHADPAVRSTLSALDGYMTAYFKVGSEVPPEYRLGGDGYTHSIPYFGRMVREGFSGYADRVARHLDTARARGDAERVAFYHAMEDVLAGIAAFHRRCLQALRETASSKPEGRALLKALRRGEERDRR